ncbi:MAG: OB-fold nucleic acid binding domain-containing protein [Nanoarchaeota archaeon]
MVQQRQVAYKVWISDLISGKFVKEEGEWDPNYVIIRNNLKVSRVNIIASVVNKYKNDENSYAYITIDDGSGAVDVRAWREDITLLGKCEIGDLILLIGRAKEFNENIYVIPELIKKLDNSSWAKVRKIELEKEFGVPVKVDKVSIDDKKLVVSVDNRGGIVVKEESAGEMLTQTSRQKVLDYISKKEEVTYDEITENLKIDEKEANDIIKELLREGEIYQPKPNYLKVI